MSGCGVGPMPAKSIPETVVAGVQGTIHGGQNPVRFANVDLMAAGTGGYGTAPAVLSSIQSDTNGNFTLPGHKCPVPDSLVYIQATGGDSGDGTNSAIDLVAVVGKCSAAVSTLNVVVNEVTTVAAAYVLAPFASVTASGTGIATSPANVAGLNNAAGPANNLVNIGSGTARAVNEISGLILPTAEIDSLGDILAACVNTNGPGSANCATLFANTTVSGVAPTDTFQAALNIALHPGANVGTLFGLASANPPFAGGLTGTPKDFAVMIGYNGANIDGSSGTNGVAIDAAGNAWIATGNTNGGANPNPVHQLNEISPAGVYLSGTAGYGAAYIDGPEQVAIDRLGHVFVAQSIGNDLLEFDSSGNFMHSTTSTAFANCNGAAIDATGNIWVSNFNGTQVVEITTDGTTSTGNAFNTGRTGAGVAIDQSAVWVSNYNNGFPTGTVSMIALPADATATLSPGGTPSAMALDANGAAWTTLVHSVAKFDNTGALVSGGGFAQNATGVPQDIAIDGLNQAWVSNFQGPFVASPNTNPGSLIQMANDGTVLSPNDGFVGTGAIASGPQVPGGIAIDGSGNVWISGYAVANANNGSSVTENVVAEVIGIAAPVVTPLSVAVTGNEVGMRP
ncbi:MAG TPA: hypothetical protein VIJ79_08095 [Acidobacteriaceae bacterium]